MVERITSAQNPKIKELLALQEKSRERREKGLFVVEGRRELEHCMEAGILAEFIRENRDKFLFSQAALSV